MADSNLVERLVAALYDAIDGDLQPARILRSEMMLGLLQTPFGGKALGAFGHLIEAGETFHFSYRWEHACWISHLHVPPYVAPELLLTFDRSYMRLLENVSADEFKSHYTSPRIEVTIAPHDPVSLHVQNPTTVPLQFDAVMYGHTAREYR